MRGRGRVQSLAASPTMVGAITTLIVIVAVFLAYNASNGLPFVPVYRISAILPNASRLAPNNEVRIGGSRVGVVESIEPVVNKENGKTAAKLDLKLDKSVEPLPADTHVRVRYKSSFGLKYLELTRGKGAPMPEGATIPISQSSSQTEFDDIANTFDTKTRSSVRGALEGYGNAFAARGQSLNETIQDLNPLFKNLLPVSRVLTAKGTRLSRFFPALGRSAAIVAPVAAQQAELFTNLAITFGAFSQDVQALEATIASGPPTLAEGTVALRIQRPFLHDTAVLSAELRPGVKALHQSLPTLNDALAIGARTLARTPPINVKLGNVFAELKGLVKQPQTKTTLLRLRETFNQAAPAANWIVPFQTVCDYWNYWFTYLPNALSEPDPIGTVFRQQAINFPGAGQIQGALTGSTGISANGKNGPFSPNPGFFAPRSDPILHGNPYAPAVDSNGNADCQAGQTGYLLGKYPVPGQAASNPAMALSDLPGVRGPTFNGRKSEPSVLK
jgi:phospholipid/cholesterol/gamma-HCH transport system substrate-binding protein